MREKERRDKKEEKKGKKLNCKMKNFMYFFHFLKHQARTMSGKLLVKIVFYFFLCALEESFVCFCDKEEKLEKLSFLCIVCLCWFVIVKM